jgi:rubrerythrin
VHATVVRVRVAPSTLDRLLKPLHRWVWQDAHRRGKKLLRFAETEDAGGRDLSRAAELTEDPLLRRLYLRHSQDEHRHADLFRSRGREVLLGSRGSLSKLFGEANWLAPGERGLDELRVDGRGESRILAFLHLSEKAAAGRFTLYRSLLQHDAVTRDVFGKILEDEVFHMSYTRSQLARVAPKKQGLRLWQSRLGRMWKAYLRLATALASLFGTVFLRLQYFVVLPLFALLAKRSMRREPEGFSPPRARSPLTSQY